VASPDELWESREYPTLKHPLNTILCKEPDVCLLDAVFKEIYADGGIPWAFGCSGEFALAELQEKGMSRNQIWASTEGRSVTGGADRRRPSLECPHKIGYPGRCSRSTMEKISFCFVVFP
jgi:hypothetical protein